MATVLIAKPDGSHYRVSQTRGAGAVSYWDIAEEYSEDWQTDAVEIRRIVECNWSDNAAFLLDMLGWAFFNSSSGLLERHLPEPHPVFSDLFCVSARMMKNSGTPIIDPTAGFFSYFNLVAGDVDPATSTIAMGRSPESGKTRWNLTYKKPPYVILSDAGIVDMGTGLSDEMKRWVEKRYSYAVEHLPLAGTSFKFVDTGLKASLEKFPLRLPSKTLIYTWYGVPADPDTGLLPSGLETNIETVEGTTNNAMFEGRYAIGTLLCEAPETTRKLLANGQFSYDIAYKLVYRKQGWNSKYRPYDGTHNAGFYPIVVDGGSGLPPYPLTDFTKLFRFT